MTADDNSEHGLIDNWLQHIKDVGRFHSGTLENLEGEAKLDALCELNIVEQVTNVYNTTIVQDAWKRGDELSIHGWVYGIEDGVLKNLDISVDSREAFLEKKLTK